MKQMKYNILVIKIAEDWLAYKVLLAKYGEEAVRIWNLEDYIDNVYVNISESDGDWSWTFDQDGFDKLVIDVKRILAMKVFL